MVLIVLEVLKLSLMPNKRRQNAVFCPKEIRNDSIRYRPSTQLSNRFFLKPVKLDRPFPPI